MTQSPHISASSPRSVLGGAPLQVDAWVKSPKDWLTGAGNAVSSHEPTWTGQKLHFLDEIPHVAFLVGFQAMPRFLGWFKHTRYIGSLLVGLQNPLGFPVGTAQEEAPPA